MHPENKLTNHGKQVTSGAQSQIPNVNQQEHQGPASNLGSKGTGPGNHGVKTNQISPGLKSVGGMMKTKSKRERSISVDAGEQKDTLAPVLESEAKVEGAIRRKRRCVLEKKQPYSGDEWCSGAETEEEEEKPSTTAHREHVMSSPGQSLSGTVESVSGPSLGCGLGPGLRSDQPSHTSQQVVYVFTTSLANSAAEAVMHGQTDSILLFHQQNVPRTKLDQQCPGVGKLPSLSEQLSTSSTPPTGTPKSQSSTPRPASVGGVIGGHLTRGNTPSSTGQPDSEVTHVHQGATPSHNNCGTSHPLGPGGSGQQRVGAQGCGVDGSGIINHPGTAVSPSANSSMLSVHLQGDPSQQGGQGSIEGLSKEQLEHRERSLQTLRDIEKLLLRSGAGAGHGDPGVPNSNPNNESISNNNTDGYQGHEDEENNSGRVGSSCLSDGVPPIRGIKKHEEPLQSIISQTQNLSGPCVDDTLTVRHHTLPPHHHLASPSGLDMGPLLGPEGLTPEQIAWRKLQEEYYQEKRRQQEMNPHTHPQHFRMMPEMPGMSGGPPLMMRGPPPPYHSKPGDQQWGPGPIIGGGMGGNVRMMDMHQDGPRGPRFLGHMQRGPPGGGGYPGSPGGVLPMDAIGSQRSPRPGMGWLDDMAPNMPGVGPFHGCYASGGPGGPTLQMQSSMDRHSTREEMFHVMEKHQLHGLRRLELEQLSRQQQQGGLGGPRMMDNTGGPGFPNHGIGNLPSRGDPMEFPNSRTMIGSPIGDGGGPLMRDMVDSPIGGNLNINMNMNLHQQHILAQKLREGPGSEIASPEDNTRIRATPNGRVGANKIMVHGQDVTLQFPNQGPFSGGQGDGPYLQQSDPEMFRSDQQGTPQIGGNSRLSHMPVNTGHKADRAPCHPSDLSINVNSLGSPAMPPPHQLKSPPLSQESSPLMPSPSTTGLKSPNQLASTGPPHPPLSATSGAGTPSNTSMKSPQMVGSSLGLRSPSVSPGHHKSPAMTVASPRWTASPKTSLASPGGISNSKGVGNGGSSTETGLSLPPRSSTSTPSSQTPNMPFTSSPDAPPSQNPLSLIMSQMSKYAMPTSIPLYHDAIKTIATSDDEMPTDRLLLPGANIQGNMANHQSTQMLLSSQGSMGPHNSPQSPTGMVLSGNQQLSLDPSGPLLPSPNPIAMPVMMGGGAGHPDGIGPCNMSPMHPPSQMGGFSRIQAPLHSPVGGMGQQYPHPSDDILPSQQMHHLSKGMPNQRPPHPPDSFPSMPIGEGPDLSEVIRPTHTGIPEFDLSRIIPADKPSSTLQYFPKSEAMSQLQQSSHQGHLPHQAPSAQLLKQLYSSGPLQSNTPSSNPHIANLQNMMAEQQLPLQPSHCGLRPAIGMTQGGARSMGPGVMRPGPICHPGHLMGRTGMSQQQQQHHHQQQAMMTNSLLQHQSHMTQGTMTQQQHPHNLIAQQNMMMQTKQRGMPIPGDHFGQQGAVLSPQGSMMGHPQSAMIGSQGIRQRGLSLDSPLGYGPGSMANMPF